MPNEANKNKRANHSLQANTTSGEKVEVTNLPFSDSQSWTISFWVKPTTITAAALTFGGSELYSGAGGFILYLNNPGIIQFYSNPNRTYFAFQTGSNVVSVNTWHHVIFKYNYGVDYRIYVDGILQAVSTGNGGSDLSYQWPTQDFGLFESASPSYAGYRLRGALSDWCFFNYALSDTATSVGDTATGQIAQLYGDGLSLSNPMSLSPAPTVYYPLSDSVWNGSNYITPNNAVQDYVFDNTNNTRVLTRISVSDLTNCTQAVWFKTSTNAQSNKYLFFCGPYSTFSISLQGTDTVRGDIIVNPATSGANPSVTFSYADGKWHHYILNFDGSGVSMYIDGVLVARQARSGTLRNGTTFTAIGNVSGLNSNAGAIGEFSNFIAYEHTLTDGGVSVGDVAGGEIATLYNNGSPIKTLANIPQSSNLKAWYKLDASEIYDNSTTEWEINNSSNPSIYNNFMDFNNFYMKVYPIGSGKNSTGGLTLPDTYTISWWAKTSLSSNGGFFEGELHTGGDSAPWGNIFRYNSISGGKYRLYNAGSPVDVTSDIANGAWHHILLTYDSSTTTVTVYTDNVQTFTSSSRNYGTGNNIGRIGSGSDGSSYYTGDMSNISIWDGVVTNSQRDELYNNGAPKDLTNNSNYSNLKHWYIFNSQTTGTRTLNDQKGSNNLLAYSQHTPAFGFINTLAGNSAGMSRSNLIQSNLIRVFNDNVLSLSGGTAAYAQTGSGFYPSSGNFTFSVWLKNTSTSRGGIFSKGTSLSNASEFGLAIAGTGGNFTTGGSADNGKLVFMFDAASAPASTYLATSEVLESNKWYNFVATYTPGDLKLYLNGSISSSTTSITKNTFSDQRPKLNVALQNGWNFKGQTSNWAFFDTVLSPTEVKEIWNNGLPGDLKSHSKTANLKNWIKGVKGAGNQVLLDYVGSTAFTGSYTIGPPISSGFTDFQGTSSGFSAPSNTVTNIISDAPYSNNNAVSVDMQPTNNGAISNTWGTPTSGRTTETPEVT